jgi:hypothetical protein
MAKERITLERVMEAINRSFSSLENPGFCRACGAEVEGCEPDMEGGECELCGADAVVGAENLLMEMA